MGSIVSVPIRPASMYSDIVENELGVNHQEVVNLRLGKRGEWELAKKYKVYVDGLTDARAFIEVTEDKSADRFLLIQDGTKLKRIDYDSGYENEPHQVLVLPAGITISAGANLRFHYYRGIVRISGASEPLWYGYIDRELFHGDDSFTVQGWFLKKAEIRWPDGTNDVEVPSQNEFYTADPVEGVRYSIVAKFFYIFDDGQYEQIKNLDFLTGDASADALDLSNSHGVLNRQGTQFQVRVNGAGLKGVMFNERITGIGLAFAVKDTTEEPWTGDENEIFSVPVTIPINEEMQDQYLFVLRSEWSVANPFEVPLNSISFSQHSSFVAGYLGTGVSITIHFEGSTIETTVLSIDWGDASNDIVLTVTENLSSLFGPGGVKGNFTITIHPKWQYDSVNGYFTFVGIDVQALGTAFTDFAGYNQFTEGITPDWRDHFVIASRAYVSSREDEEGDSLRYSPLHQFDVFPADNIISSEVGDTDSVIRAFKQDSYFIMLKRRSLSKGSFISSYDEHIGIVDQGLYSENGLYYFKGLLFFMDEDDLYVFDTVKTESFFRLNQLRNLYRNNITTDSFILHNKLENELWFFIGTKILVWQYERDNYFYLRELDLELPPTVGILGHDNKMLVAAGDRILDFNASSQFDEIQGYRVKTRIIPTKPHRYHNQIDRLETYLSSSGDVLIRFKDDNEGISDTHEVESPSGIAARTVRSKKLFKELYLEMENQTDTSDLTAEIREGILQIEAWNGR